MLAAPAMVLGVLLAVVFVFDTTANASCNPSGSAVTVDPTSVPPGPIAGYRGPQLANAANVMLAAQRLGLTLRDQQIGVMTAMGESSLQVLDHGDAVGPDSRGLFQQRDNGAWGTLAERMDPFRSATNFFKVEAGVPSRESMAPTLVANAVQGNADPYYYEPFWAPAGEVVQALGAAREQNSAAAPASTPALPSRYALGAVHPQATVVANTLGPMFGIKTVGGYREGAQDHGTGLALDFMIDNVPSGRATGDRLAAYVQDHASDLGVTYVIWSQRIWSSERADEGWRPMEDRGSPTQNHMDHVHVSLSGAGLTADTCPQQRLGPVSQTGWAAPARGPMTSDYGPRPNPGAGGSTWHRGIDLGGGGCDGPIWAANAGTVAYVGPAAGVGNLIEVDHGQGVVTRYGHMYDSGLLVRTGDRVAAGQQIGRIGSNGNSTGCHLHFAVQINGGYVDPKAFLDQVGVTITN